MAAVLALQGRTLNNLAAACDAGSTSVALAMRGERLASAGLVARLQREIGPAGWAFIVCETDTLQAPPLAEQKTPKRWSKESAAAPPAIPQAPPAKVA